MKTQKTISLFRLVALVVFVAGLFCIQTAAQTPAPAPAPSPEARKMVTVSRVIVENKAAAAQVVTILHTLSGLKVLTLLAHSKEQVEAIEKLTLPASTNCINFPICSLAKGKSLMALLFSFNQDFTGPNNQFAAAL